MMAAGVFTAATSVDYLYNANSLQDAAFNGAAAGALAGAGA